VAVDALFIEARCDEVVDVAALEDMLLRAEMLSDATLLPHADRREQRHGLLLRTSWSRPELEK